MNIISNLGNIFYVSIPLLMLGAFIVLIWGTAHGLILYTRTKDSTSLLALTLANLFFILIPIYLFVATNYGLTVVDEIGVLMLMTPFCIIGISIFLFFVLLPKKFGKTKAFTIYSYAPIALLILIIMWAWLGWQEATIYPEAKINTTTPPPVFSIPSQVNQ